MCNATRHIEHQLMRASVQNGTIIAFGTRMLGIEETGLRSVNRKLGHYRRASCLWHGPARIANLRPGLARSVLFTKLSDPARPAGWAGWPAGRAGRPAGRPTRAGVQFKCLEVWVHLFSHKQYANECCMLFFFCYPFIHPSFQRISARNSALIVEIDTKWNVTALPYNSFCSNAACSRILVTIAGILHATCITPNVSLASGSLLWKEVNKRSCCTRFWRACWPETFSDVYKV